MNEINLNQNALDVGSLPLGWTQQIPVRIHRRRFFLDVRKDNHAAAVELYDYSPADAPKVTRNLHTVNAKPDAVLRLDFFDDFEKIEAAQRIMYKYAGKIV